jgi:hypothetical protein
MHSCKAFDPVGRGGGPAPLGTRSHELKCEDHWFFVLRVWDLRNWGQRVACSAVLLWRSLESGWICFCGKACCFDIGTPLFCSRCTIVRLPAGALVVSLALLPTALCFQFTLCNCINLLSILLYPSICGPLFHLFPFTDKANPSIGFGPSLNSEFKRDSRPKHPVYA